MSTFTYYIPQTIKVVGDLKFFHKQIMFVGNDLEAKKTAKQLRKDNPNKTIRVCHGTISEYI